MGGRTIYLFVCVLIYAGSYCVKCLALFASVGVHACVRLLKSQVHVSVHVSLLLVSMQLVLPFLCVYVQS